MSSTPSTPSTPTPPSPQATPQPGAWTYVWTAGGGLLLLLVLVIAGLLFYASTGHFSNQVRQKLIAVLEDATGGRVELKSFQWSVRHLSVDVEGLTIHGLEGPDELPYAHFDRLYARAKILSLFRARLGLDYLEVDRPAVHLIVYPDGSTNQPKPKAASQSNNGQAVNTIFDLQAGRVEIRNGLALFNQRAIPFALTANDLGLVITYAPVTDHYLGKFACSGITVKQAKMAAVNSKLDLSVEAARDAVELKALHFVTGKTSLTATGSLDHFADPKWKATADGKVDLAEVSAMGVLDGFTRGSVDLGLTAQGSGGSQFAVDGKAKITNGSYAMEYFWIDGANLTTRVHVTPDEIALTDLVGRPRQGGVVYATLRYLNWSAPDRPAPKAVERGKRAAGSALAGSALPTQRMIIRARVQDVRLSAVLESVADRPYRDLGFDTQGDGLVNVDWAGSADDLTVGAVLTTSAPPFVGPGQVPLSGTVDAEYFQRGGRVEIRQLNARSPATTLDVTGSLGVYPLEEPSNLSVHLVNHNLGEFDRVLKVLGLGANGQLGIAGLPVHLTGEATFDGSAGGSLVDPSFKGHLIANQFSTDFPAPATQATAPVPVPAGAVASKPHPLPSAKQVAVPAAGPNEQAAPGSAVLTIPWDRLDTLASYSSSLIAVERATLTRGKTVIHASGQLQAHRINSKKVEFDDVSAIQATAQVQDAPVTDLLAIAGQTLPVTGAVNFQAHVGGTLDNLAGGGTLNLQGGTIAGQPYHSLVASLTLSGQEIDLTKLTFLQDGGTVIGNGNYNLKTRQFLGNLDGTNFELAHFPQSKDPRLAVAGALKFDAHASGTIDALSVLAGIHLRNLELGGQPAGSLEAIVHTQGGTALFTAQNSLASAGLQIKGQTALHGDFATQANLVLTNLNIAPFMRAFHVQSVSGNSSIGGTINVAGPLREPKQFSGDAEITRFQVTLQGLTLQAAEPLRASLHDGVLHLTQAHITGPDTNLAITGTAALMGDQALAVTGNGAINMKLAQTFDADITSSGQVNFNVNARGTIPQPALSGNLHLNNVALALNDLPNGISKLNGDLIFDQNRLQVQELTGMTGGGELKFGGFLAYQQGLYGDFTATGKDVRVRYLGISATADTTLHLQGSQNNMSLSGNIQITRFIIGPNVDFASFAPSPGADVPPNPNAPSSHVRLDVRIFSAPQLDFQNSYAQLAGSLDLRIRGTIAQPAILGRISVTDGTANFAGTTYRLQRGEIFFTNPVRIEPIIDLDATTRVEEYDVTIGLHGNASQLTPTFRSEPPLPQADVISLLALGRTQQEQALYSQQEQSVGVDSTTNALLGGALNAAVGTRVQRLFGVGSVKIDPTYVGTIGSSSARITVQQNLSRNVQVTYATNVNATAQQLIQVQVNVTSSVSVQALRDESGVFSLVLKVHKRYH